MLCLFSLIALIPTVCCTECCDIVQETGDLVGWVSEMHDGTGTHDVLRITLNEPKEGDANQGARSVFLPILHVNLYF